MILETLWQNLDFTWALTLLVGLLTLVTVRHMLLVRSLPPGPFPFPLIGNLHFFNSSSLTLFNLLDKWRKKYGNVLTIWIGNNPTVIVSGWDSCKDALVNKRNDLSGRLKRHSGELFLGSANDVMFSDYGPCWETLRRILFSAVRKYSVSEKLAALVVDIVDEVADLMVKEGKPIDPTDYTYLALYSVLACSTFGKRYGLKDPEFLGLRGSNDRLNDIFDEGVPSDALLILKYVFWKKERKMKAACDDFMGYFHRHFAEHKKTYKKGVVRDFIDAVLAARDEAEEESKDTVQYMKDENLVGLTMDLFSAGTETTRLTINWLLLYVCNFPEVQDKMQKEIDDNIGSRDPVQSDRDNCPYVQACITEILRVRPVIDYTLEHKAICNTEIGGYKIPEGATALFNILSCHKDPSVWPDPEEFKPERFLESDGRFNNSRFTGYMPFGLGRRACPGEKLGLVDVFLIIVRLLQNHVFQLDGGPGTANLDVKVVAFANHPYPYKVVVERRKEQ